jgi:hypothetical protein
MFLFGHLGIGERLGRPFTNPSTRAALLLGCVLPDLVDKPLYYGLAFATGKHAAELGLISSTRTIGHTLLFAILCGALVRGPRGRALFVGMVTHLMLDLGGDLFGSALVEAGLASPSPSTGPSTLAAVLFPLLGPHFPISPFHSLKEHALSLGSAYVLSGELLGATLLALDWRKRRASPPPQVN